MAKDAKSNRVRGAPARSLAFRRTTETVRTAFSNLRSHYTIRLLVRRKTTLRACFSQPRNDDTSFVFHLGGNFRCTCFKVVLDEFRHESTEYRLPARYRIRVSRLYVINNIYIFGIVNAFLIDRFGESRPGVSEYITPPIIFIPLPPVKIF